MTGDCHVRFYERRGAKLPPATHPIFARVPPPLPLLAQSGLLITLASRRLRGWDNYRLHSGGSRRSGDEESPALIGGEGSPDGQAPPASAKERWLKRQIVNSPFLLPGVDERRTAVATEVQMPGGGSADVVVVDAEGEITIVECKLAKNPEMRRSVIGQLFEYAAALWKLDIEDFERSLAATGTARPKPFKDPARWKEADFRNTVSRNLADGAFRLIIAVDEITERLKRTVVFINSLTPPEVRFLAMELPGAGEEGGQLPVPVFYGDNSAEIGPLPPTLKPDKWGSPLILGVSQRPGRSIWMAAQQR